MSIIKKLFHFFNIWSKRRFLLRLHRMYLKAGFSEPLDRAIDVYLYIEKNLPYIDKRQ